MPQTRLLQLCVFVCAAALLGPMATPGDTAPRQVHHLEADADAAYAVMTDVPPLPSHPGPKPAIGDPPAAFSWRDRTGDWTTPARNQGDCGSCWAFAAMSALEGVINVREGVPSLDPDLSEQYILSCLPYAGGCGGGSAYRAFRYIMDTGVNGNNCNGVVTESCFPYQADDDVPCSGKCPDWEQHLVPITDYEFWDSDGSPADRDRIKTQVMSEGPVVTYIEATDDFRAWGRVNHGSDDYYPYEPASGHNHCVSIVGWKDDDGIPHGGYWICKNSWGSAWGNEGFFNIEYGSLNIDTVGICRVDYDAGSVDWPPAADPGGPYHASPGETITFDGSGSRDDEDEITAYQWTFDDGTVMQGPSVSHAFDSSGVHTATLTVTDENGGQASAAAAAYIEPWQTGDSWTYDFKDISISLDDGVTGEAAARVTGLSMSVEGEDYTLTFRGKLTGSYDLAGPVACSGKVLWSAVTGSLAIDEEFGFTGADLTIRALATITFPELPLPVPVPVTVTGDISFTQPWRILGFPHAEGKEWSTSLSTVQLEGSASTLLGLVSQPLSYRLELPALPATCHGMETVNVDAGSFEAYHLSYLDLVDLWYAPEVSTIVKITGSYEDTSVAGELTDSSRPS